MTTIFICKGKVYADSNHYIGEESFHSLSKINACEPFTITWKKPPLLDGQQVDDVPQRANATDFLMETVPDFEDTIHGYTIAGHNPMGLRYLRDVKDRNFRRVIFDLWKMWTWGYMSTQHHATLLLFGEQRIYQISPDNAAGAPLVLLPLDEVIAFGSGCEFVLKSYMMHPGEPLRALIETMIYDEYSEGIIDCWELPSVERPRFKRLSIFNARTRGELMAIIRDKKPIIPDLISFERVMSIVGEEESKVKKPVPRYTPSRPRRKKP